MRLRGSILSPGRVVLSGFFIMVFSLSVHATDESIPPSSWIYGALRRFELMGLVSVGPDIPLTRSTVKRYVSSIEKEVLRRGLSLKPRERFLLGRLKGEFLHPPGDVSAREDKPAVVFSGDRSVLALDASFGSVAGKRVERTRGEVDGFFVPQILAGVGESITLESNYFVGIFPEVDRYVRNRKPSSRTRSFRGVTSEFERGYFSIHGEGWRFSLGRDYLNFGNDLSEGMLISSTAGSFDHFSFIFDVSRLNIKTVHAVLDPLHERRLAAHRVTVRMPGGVYLGVGEAVLYTGRGLDYTYLVPFSSYYSNQFNERGDDNILWSFDWKVPLKRFLFYGEFLVDDLQYERDEPAPDRIGFNVAVNALIPAGDEDIFVAFSYTYIDIFTYAHKDSLGTSYVTGNGAFPDNPLIGSQLGPDADRLQFEASYCLTAPLEVIVGYEVIRRGEGNDLREWNRCEDPHLPFPSGDVLTERYIRVGGRYDLRRGSYIDVMAGVRLQSGGDLDGRNRDYFGSLELRLEI